jgi:hypothetical protein
VIIAVLLAIAGGLTATCASRHARRNINDSRKTGFLGLVVFE